MKSHHLLIASILAVLAFVFIFVQSISPSSSAAGVQCNPERLNQVHDLSPATGSRGIINEFFIVPLEYSYGKLYSIINASIMGSCSTVNHNCSYYVNGALCGTMVTNMTPLGNTSGGLKVYSLSCLNSIKSGTNILTLNLNSSSVGGGGLIESLAIEMELVPANC